MDKRSFFDKHAERWDEGRRADEDRRLARVVELAEVRPGHRVLDVGTGTGVLVPHLLRAVGPGGTITGVDISPRMLRKAEEKRFPSQVVLQVADVHHLPFSDATFDRVICNAAFPHFEDKAGSLREMVRVLGNGGVLVISHPIGRAAVNALHREVGGAVAGDRVPPPEQMTVLLETAGLCEIEVVDEPEFFLARGRRPG